MRMITYNLQLYFKLVWLLTKIKQKLLFFRNGGPLRSYENWFYYNKPLNVTALYKYLGFLFTHTLSWNLAKLKLATQARKAIVLIKAFYKHFVNFFHSEHFELFDSIIKPILLYGAEVWGTSLAVEIEQIQAKFCKEFLGVNKTTNDCMKLGECGRLPLCSDYYVKCIKYWTKLLHMPNFRYSNNRVLKCSKGNWAE